MSTDRATPDWRLHGVRVVRADELDSGTPQTPGMSRAGAITTARAGAEKLWAGTVNISCVVVRSGQEPVVVNLDLPDVEAEPQVVRWVDDLHD